jgi:uncharacterized protein YlxP (DUF503 family)
MVIGVLEIEIVVPWSESLKDKRRVVKSLKDRLHREHLVAVAEVGDHDLLQRARVAVACVGADGRRIGETLDRIALKVAALRDGEATIVGREIFRAADVPESRRIQPDDSLESDLLHRGARALDEAGPEQTP